MLSAQQRQQQSFNDSYTALILEEAEKLYNKLTTELTNSVIAATQLLWNHHPGIRIVPFLSIGYLYNKILVCR